MARIEGEFSGFDPNKVTFESGKVDVADGIAKFQIEGGNENVYARAENERIHIFSFPGFELGQVTIADASLHVADFVGIDYFGYPRDGDPVLISAQNVPKILGRTVVKGGKVEIERDGVYKLTIRNNG